MKSAILLVFSCLCLHGATLEGSFHSAALFQQDPLDSSLPPVQYYEDLDFEIRGIADRDICLYSGLNYSNRYSDDYRKGCDIRHLFLDFTAFSGKISGRAGRQWYYEGLSPATLDGMRLKFHGIRGFSLLLAGGRSADSPYPGSSFLPKKEDTTRFLGDAAISYSPIPSLRTGATYERLFDGRGFSSDRVRLNAIVIPAVPLTAGGEVIADLNNRKAERVRAFTAFSPAQKIDLSLDLAREGKNLDSSSRLEILSREGRYEARAGADYAFSGSRSAHGAWTSRFFDDGRIGHMAEAGLSWDRFFAGAEQDLITPLNTLARVGATLPKMGPVTPDLQGTILRYRTASGGGPFREAYAVVAGLDFHPFDFWDFRMEGQAVRNRWFNHDLRLLLKTVLRLSRGGDE